MSLMVNGQLHPDDWFETSTGSGEYIRRDSQFRHWITADGSPGPDGSPGFPAASGRYHLYVSYACPWASRTLMYRALKGLQDHISVSVVNPEMGPEGWKLGGFPGATEDHLYGHRFMHELYRRARPDYTGIVTVPVLWDKQTQTIVNNESSEIIRMLNSAFDGITGNRDDYYPPPLRDAIDALNAQIYNGVNNGVYRTGFATRQDRYEQAFDRLFETLNELEQRLSTQRYLTGTRITEADLRLFPTLIRFDAVYYGHFKCNLRRIIDYPNLHNYMLELYQIPAIRATVHMDHIKQHYYWSHDRINPSRIVPKGPLLDLDRPHDRNRFRKE